MNFKPSTISFNVLWKTWRGRVYGITFLDIIYFNSRILRLRRFSICVLNFSLSLCWDKEGKGGGLLKIRL